MTSPESAARVARFRELHSRGIFVIANAWDAGSARVLAGLGFPAIATSSGAMANSLGRLDGAATREEALAHARSIAAAVDVPVSADLEKCFADPPIEAAQTIRLAGETGLAGGSIEDATGRKDAPIFDFNLAVERVAAAAEAARGIAHGFVLTARTENHIRGITDLDDTIRRLQAFERAGADVLMAPGLPDLAAVRLVCQSLTKPVNFMVGIPGKSFSMAQLEEAGVRRVSLATSLYRAAMTGLVEAAKEIRGSGTFGYLEGLVPSAEFSAFMRR